MKHTSFTLILSSLASLMLIGCVRKSEATNRATYEGHSLGETPMIWGLEETAVASDPLEVCQEIVKTGADPQSDNYRNCQRFVLTGDYTISIGDWKMLGRQKHFVFVGWRLARIEIEEPNDVSTMRNFLTQRYGPPVRNFAARDGGIGTEDHWRGPDGAKIELIPRHDPEHQNTSIIMIMAGGM